MTMFASKLKISSHGALLLLGLVALLGAGCAKQPPVARQVRVLVVDGHRTDGVLEASDVTKKGWYFGRREYYRNNNDGPVFSDLLAHHLAKVPGLEVHSRDDFRIYAAQKERLVRDAAPDLTRAQYRDLLARQEPVDYGRSLNADYVVRPIINESFLATNKVFLWWYGKLTADVEIWDVQAGELIWTYQFDDTDSFDSQRAMMEECARKVARRVDRRNVLGLRAARK